MTRADVAREAGTSEAVVSYVVNDSPQPVAAATRQRVLEAIERTGYRPNAFARALAGGSTRTYGFIVPNISNPFISEMAHEVEERLFGLGYVLLLGDSADDKRREGELIDSFVERRVDGLIYMGVDQDLRLDGAEERDVPVVVFTHADSDGRAPSVRIDERAATRAATEHLLGHGRTRPAVITGPTTMMNSGERLGGWRDAVEASGLPVLDERVEHAPYTRRGGYESGLRLLSREERPDAVLAGNEQQAIGLLAAVDDLGLSSPGDVAIIALNGTPDSEFTVPALSVVLQPFGAMAEAALEVLTHPDRYPPEPILFEPELVLRASCGCDYRR